MGGISTLQRDTEQPPVLTPPGSGTQLFGRAGELWIVQGLADQMVSTQACLPVLTFWTEDGRCPPAGAELQDGLTHRELRARML